MIFAVYLTVAFLIAVICSAICFRLEKDEFIVGWEEQVFCASILWPAYVLIALCALIVGICLLIVCLPFIFGYVLANLAIEYLDKEESYE